MSETSWLCCAVKSFVKRTGQDRIDDWLDWRVDDSNIVLAVTFVSQTTTTKKFTTNFWWVVFAHVASQTTLFRFPHHKDGGGGCVVRDDMAQWNNRFVTSRREKIRVDKFQNWSVWRIVWMLCHTSLTSQLSKRGRTARGVDRRSTSPVIWW